MAGRNPMEWGFMQAMVTYEKTSGAAFNPLVLGSNPRGVTLNHTQSISPWAGSARTWPGSLCAGNKRHMRAPGSGHGLLRDPMGFVIHGVQARDEIEIGAPPGSATRREPHVAGVPAR